MCDLNSVEMSLAEDTQPELLEDYTLFQADFHDPGPVAIVRVGSDDDSDSEPDPDKYWTFAIYENHLAHYSPFLKSALEKSQKESQIKVVNLPNDNPRVFKLFVQWLYTGGYNFGLYECATINDHLMLYILAHTLQVSKLKDQVIDMLIEDRWSPTEEDVYSVYKNTLESSNLRKLACYQTLEFRKAESTSSKMHWVHGKNSKTLSTACPDFYLDLFQTSHAQAMVDSSYMLPRPSNCFFHEHDEKSYCKYLAQNEAKAKEREKLLRELKKEALPRCM